MAAPPNADPRDLAERHAREAEQLLGHRWISPSIKAQVHASLATYYAHRQGER
jgi:hypothetical protein